jgi:hypothetical protein
MARARRYSETEVREAIAASRSLSEALRKLGLRPAGGNHATLRKLVERYAIPTEHFERDWAQKGRQRNVGIPLDEILVADSTYSNRARLKHRLYECHVKQRRCELCGQGEEWRGRRMALILDHINGAANDNRIENLRIVCPNCAATLDTHCGRKNRTTLSDRECARCGAPFRPRFARQRYCSQRCGSRHDNRHRDPKPLTRKVDRPTYDQLLEDVHAMSFLAVGRKYGVSDNAVRKWIRWYQAAAKPNAEVSNDETLSDGEPPLRESVSGDGRARSGPADHGGPPPR